MKKHTIRRTLAVCSLVLVPGIILGACNRHRCGKMNPERMEKVVTWKVDDFLDEIDATDGQREQVHQMKRELIGQALELRTGGTETRRAVADELLSDEPDAEKLHNLVDARIDAFRAFAHKAVDTLVENHSVLTPEQRLAIRERVDECLERR